MHSKYGGRNVLQTEPLSFDQRQAELFQPGGMDLTGHFQDVSATGTSIPGTVVKVCAVVKRHVDVLLDRDSVFDGGDPDLLGEVVDCRPHWIEEGYPDQAVPLQEHASRVSTALGLGKSQVARILGVSRTTLYDWIKGKIEPQGENAERLGILGRVTAQVCHDTERPLYHRFVDAPLEGESRSIVDLLLSDEWDELELSRLLRRARDLTTERDDRIGSSSRQEDILIDNLTGL